MSWTKVAAKGDIPTGRHSASATTVGDKGKIRYLALVM